MPIVDDFSPSGPRLGVHGSISVEIDWALAGAHRIDEKPLRPALERVYREDRKLLSAVVSLWGPEEALSYPGYMELSAIAHHGGLLFETDSDALIGSLEDLCAHGPTNLSLAAETPDDRTRILRRLHVLGTSARRRKHYVGVVTDVWRALRPTWEREGRPDVEAEVAFRRRELQRQPTWEDFSRGTCKTPEALAELVRPMGSDGELAVVPAWFSSGSLIMDLPGLVVVGVRTEHEGEGDRARSELLAQRLKAIADPTRLAILAALSRQESTVTEIARRFGLSQPTVSNHIKLLRQAGFVGPARDGRSRALVVQRDLVELLGSELQSLLVDNNG